MFDLDSCEIHTINFGTIVSGTSVTKYFMDPSCLEIKSVSYCGDSCKIDIPYELSLNESDKNKLIIKFVPQKPNLMSCSYFSVNNDSVSYILCLKGFTHDLSVLLSRKTIELKVYKTGESKVSWFELTNPSKTPALFDFQLDDCQSEIFIKPRSNIVQPGESMKIIVSYTAKCTGFRYRQLFCFIKNHVPLTLDVITSCTKEVNNFNQRIQFIESLPRAQNSYQYIFEYLNTVNNDLMNRPVTLNTRYLDLGAKDLSSGDMPNIKSFTVTNHSPVSILVKWKKDVNRVFDINPKSQVVDRNCKINFEVSFDPNINDTFYSAKLDAVLMWGEAYAFVVPFDISIHLLGNSFDQDECGWIAEYEMPEKVALPPTIPEQKVWTSFAIRKLGHLPLMFRFLPTDHSYYKFIPEHGVILDQFQVILVEFNPDTASGKKYNENRKLLINTSHLIEINVVGNAEYPNLWFPKGPQVNFIPIPLNCLAESFVEVKNTTRHPLRFKFETSENDLLEAKLNRSCIFPGEQRKLWLTYSPNILGEFTISRFLSIFSNIENTSRTVQNKHVIQFSGESVMPKLTTVPLNLHLGDYHRDEKIKNCFVVSNIGESVVYIKFKLIPIEILSQLREFICDPDFLILEPGKQEMVRISFLPGTFGYQSYQVVAVICKTPSPNIEVSTLHLLNIYFFCHYYQFTIKDIVCIENGECSPLSEFHLWNIMNIDGWNEKLKNISSPKAITDFRKEVLEMSVPEFEIQSKPIHIDLLVQNQMNIGCTFNIVKATPCNCQPLISYTGRILKTSKSQCPHKSQVSFLPACETFKPKESKVISLIVKYEDNTVRRSIFNISVYCSSHPSVKHTLTVNVTRNALPKGEIYAGLCFNVVQNVANYRLTDVFIGNPDPPLQGFCLYNNSNKDVAYEVSLDETNKEKYITCFNSQGVIKANSLHLILLQFSPIEPVEYEERIKLTFGNKEQFVLVRGRGILHHSRNPLLLETKMPSKCSLPEYEANTVIISPHRIILDSMTTHSNTTRIFKFKNNSSYIINFKWLPCEIDEIIRINIEPQEGQLNKKEEIICKLSAKTYSVPFIFTISPLCQIFNINSQNRPLKMDTLMLALKKKEVIEGMMKEKREMYPDKYASISVGIECCTIEWLKKLPNGEKKINKSIRTISPSIEQYHQVISSDQCNEVVSSPISTDIGFIFTVSQVLRQLFLDVFESKQFQRTLSDQISPKYYASMVAPLNLHRNHPDCNRFLSQQDLKSIIENAVISFFSKFSNINHKSADVLI